MAQPVSGVDLLTQAILSQAEAEAKKIRDNAEAEAQTIITEAEQEAKAAQAGAATTEAARLERDNARALTAARLETRRRIREAREEWIERVFAETKTRLEALRKETLYAQILVNLVREGMAALGGEDFIVSVRPEDYDLAARTLNSAATDTRHTKVQADEGVSGGGCIVMQSDGRSLYDNSFDSVLARHRQRLRALVADALWGKDLHSDEP
jgi:V/A-type H+/Na+-transporting ATPase subunit E